jgi:hypothetical protein
VKAGALAGPAGGCARRSRRPAAALALALAALVAASLGVAAASAKAPPDPSADIALGPLPLACRAAPAGPVCERAAVARLDVARAKLGLGPYRLPGDFYALVAPRQMLVLANLDRISYGLVPIRGLSLTLDAIAKQGAQAREDPDPWSALAGLAGQGEVGYASNWAGGAPDAPVAYFEWMYDDGYGSGNIDCTSPSAPGCWGHRHTILSFGSAPTLTMGAAAIPAQMSYTLTVVETSTPAWPFSYTWAQAVAAGAGG